MNCGDCRYSHDTGTALLCWGQRFAPPVDKDDWCEGWKPQARSDEWVETGGVNYPDPFVSVQVYLPEQAPLPVVREGYVIADDNGIPTGWYVPSLWDGYELENITFWKPMSDPPKP